jgi:hypothetical protein
MQRVAVAVESRDGHPGAIEGGQVFAGGYRARQQVVDREMRRRQEPACVDLGAAQAQARDDLQRFTQRLVVQDRGVDTKLHILSSSQVQRV